MVEAIKQNVILERTGIFQMYLLLGVSLKGYVINIPSENKE